MAKKKVKIAVSFAVVLVIMAWIIFSGFNENMRYYVDIKDVQAAEDATGLRVKGYLVAGSLIESQDSLEKRFVIEDKGEEMTVVYTANEPLPDTFKDGSEVLVEGNFHPDGYFEASYVMAKCPSKYEANAGEAYSTENENYNLQGTN